MNLKSTPRHSMASILSSAVTMSLVVILMSRQCHLQRVEVPAEVIGK